MLVLRLAAVAQIMATAETAQRFVAQVIASLAHVLGLTRESPKTEPVDQITATGFAATRPMGPAVLPVGIVVIRRRTVVLVIVSVELVTRMKEVRVLMAAVDLNSR